MLQREPEVQHSVLDPQWHAHPVVRVDLLLFDRLHEEPGEHTHFEPEFDRRSASGLLLEADHRDSNAHRDLGFEVGAVDAVVEFTLGGEQPAPKTDLERVGAEGGDQECPRKPVVLQARIDRIARRFLLRQQRHRKKQYDEDPGTHARGPIHGLPMVFVRMTDVHLCEARNLKKIKKRHNACPIIAGARRTEAPFFLH